jgi:hypothetical protein
LVNGVGLRVEVHCPGEQPASEPCRSEGCEGGAAAAEEGGAEASAATAAAQQLLLRFCATLAVAAKSDWYRPRFCFWRACVGLSLMTVSDRLVSACVRLRDGCHAGWSGSSGSWSPRERMPALRAAVMMTAGGHRCVQRRVRRRMARPWVSTVPSPRHNYHDREL